MGKIATFKAKYLKDDHLFIPKGVASTLFLRRGGSPGHDREGGI